MPLAPYGAVFFPHALGSHSRTGVLVSPQPSLLFYMSFSRRCEISFSTLILRLCYACTHVRARHAVSARATRWFLHRSCSAPMCSDGSMHPPARLCVASARFMSSAHAHALYLCHKVVNRIFPGSSHHLLFGCTVSLPKGLPGQDCCVEVLIPGAPCLLCCQLPPQARGRMPPIQQNGDFHRSIKRFPSQPAILECFSLTSSFAASALRWVIGERTRGFCTAWECMNSAGLY